jgi:HNH endonuclease
MSYAHEWIYVDAHGPLGPREDVDHLCNHRACVELSHLEGVSHAENVRRSWERRGQGRKLSPDDVSRIRAMWRARRHSQSQIATLFGIDSSLVSRIVNNIYWK